MIKITATNLNELSDQINKNFAELLSSPIYKGVAGTPGTALSGVPGTRGISIDYIDVAKLNAALGAGIDYTRDEVDAALLATLTLSNPADVLSSTNLDSFIGGDKVILPDGTIHMWDSSTASWIYTEIDLVVPNEAISEARAIEILNASGSVNSALNVAYLAHSKFFNDDDATGVSANQTSVAPGSVLDPMTSDSLNGTLDDEVVFIGAKETIGLAVDAVTKQSMINVVGHVKDLHRMMQEI